MNTRLVPLPNLTDLNNTWIGLEQFFPQLAPAKPNPAYPPYNIEKINDDDYRIVVALAGFTVDKLIVELKNSELIVRDTNSQFDESKYAELKTIDTPSVEYIHKGIANRSFMLRFNLSPEIIVDDSKFVDGLLSINLHRVVPESKRPRLIKIN